MKATKSQAVAAEVSALIRARNPLLWVSTTEYARVERYLTEAAKAAGYVARTWDCAQGFCAMNGDQVFAGNDNVANAFQLILSRAKGELSGYGSGIENRQDRCVWIMRNLPVWLAGQFNAKELQQLENLTRFLPNTRRDTAQCIIVLTDSIEIPGSLKNDAILINWPIPDRDEIAQRLDVAVAGFVQGLESQEERDAATLKNGAREAAIDAAQGLTDNQAYAAFSQCFVMKRRIDPAAVAKQKQEVIKRQGVLEWLEPLPGGLDGVGGLENAKLICAELMQAYSPAARAYGLPRPKGLFLAGIPGCGKTLLAAALSGQYGIPYINFDLGSLKGGLVGESEKKIRKAIEIADGAGRCIVLFDEIDKSFRGVAGPAGDSGVQADSLKVVLTWLNDRISDAFVIMTANDILSLLRSCPELLRKGRFDEVLWVDLPNHTERVGILRATLKKYGREKIAVDVVKVATLSAAFSGAEVAALVPAAMRIAYRDKGREIVTQDMVDAIGRTTPQSKSAADTIEAMRNWGRVNAVQASLPESNVQTPREFADSRQLDI